MRGRFSLSYQTSDRYFNLKKLESLLTLYKGKECLTPFASG